jgi:cytochrome P450
MGLQKMKAAATDSNFRDFSFIASATAVSDYGECEEILLASDTFHVGVFETESAPFWQDALATTNGEQHNLRRRTLARLFSKAAVAAYERDVLDSAIDKSLREAARTRDKVGLVHTDLALLVRLVLVRVAAAIIGLDEIETPERVRTLSDYADGVAGGINVRWSKRPHAEVIEEAVVARDAFASEFYERSSARREALVQRSMRGELSVNELPADLITLMLLDKKDQWDEGLRLREAMTFLNGGIHSTAGAVAYAVDELRHWLRLRPRDTDHLTDSNFLRAIGNEAIRLHPPIPVLTRRATADVTLRGGRMVRAGEMIALLIKQANRSPEIFGEDAAVFNPHRTVPSRYPSYGLAFGAGPHLCIGKPLVTTAGHEDLVRTIAKILRAFVEADIRPDPDRPPTMMATGHDRYETYPVILRL